MRSYELQKYKESLSDRVQLAVLNKIDLVDPEMVEEIAQEYLQTGIATVCVSAAVGLGIAELRTKLVEKMEELEEQIAQTNPDRDGIISDNE